MTNSIIVKRLLDRVHSSGGSLFWDEDAECPHAGLEEATALGYLKPTGSCWGTKQGVALTRKGVEAVTGKNLHVVRSICDLLDEAGPRLSTDPPGRRLNVEP